MLRIKRHHISILALVLLLISLSAAGAPPTGTGSASTSLVGVAAQIDGLGALRAVDLRTTVANIGVATAEARLVPLHLAGQDLGTVRASSGDAPLLSVLPIQRTVGPLQVAVGQSILRAEVDGDRALAALDPTAISLALAGLPGGLLANVEVLSEVTSTGAAARQRVQVDPLSLGLTDLLPEDVLGSLPFDTILSLLSLLPVDLTGVAGDLRDTLVELLEQITSILSSVLGDAIDLVSAADLLGVVRAALDDALGEQEAAEQALDAAEAAFADAIVAAQAAASQVDQVAAAVTSALGGGGGGGGTGSDTGGGSDGLTSGGVTDTVGGVTGGVTSTAGGVTGGVTSTVGGVTSGTTGGATSTVGGVTSGTTSTTGGATSTVGGVTSGTTGTTGTTDATSTVGGVTTGTTDATSTVGGVTTGTTDTTGTTGTTGGATSTVGGVTSGSTGAASTATDAVTGAVGSVGGTTSIGAFKTSARTAAAACTGLDVATLIACLDGAVANAGNVVDLAETLGGLGLDLEAAGDTIAGAAADLAALLAAEDALEAAQALLTEATELVASLTETVTDLIETIVRLLEGLGVDLPTLDGLLAQLDAVISGLLGLLPDLLDGLAGASILDVGAIDLNVAVSANPAGSAATTTCGLVDVKILGIPAGTASCTSPLGGALALPIHSLLDALPGSLSVPDVVVEVFPDVRNTTATIDGAHRATSTVTALRVKVPSITLDPLALGDGLIGDLDLDVALSLTLLTDALATLGLDPNLLGSVLDGSALPADVIAALDGLPVTTVGIGDLLGGIDVLAAVGPLLEGLLAGLPVGSLLDGITTPGLDIVVDPTSTVDFRPAGSVGGGSTGGTSDGGSTGTSSDGGATSGTPAPAPGGSDGTSTGGPTGGPSGAPGDPSGGPGAPGSELPSTGGGIALLGLALAFVGGRRRRT